MSDREAGERIGRYRVEYRNSGGSHWHWFGSYDKPESAQDALSEIVRNSRTGRVTCTVLIEEGQP